MEQSYAVVILKVDRHILDTYVSVTLRRIENRYSDSGGCK